METPDRETQGSSSVSLKAGRSVFLLGRLKLHTWPQVNRSFGSIMAGKNKKSTGPDHDDPHDDLLSGISHPYVSNSLFIYFLFASMSHSPTVW